jgi:hypothetical protein
MMNDPDLSETTAAAEATTVAESTEADLAADLDLLAAPEPKREAESVTRAS